MSKRIDLTGQRFGRLVVVSYNEEISKQKKRNYWNCKCDCGNEKVIRGDHLSGKNNTQSCGCYNIEKVKEKWNDEEFKEMQKEKGSKMLKEKWKNEEYRKMKREACSKQLKEQWQDEEFRQMQREKGSKMLKEQWQDEEFRQMQKELSSKRLKEKWKNEEYRQMHKNMKHNYKGGITPITNYLRTLPVVSQWRKDTYTRENNRCQLTGKKVHGGNSAVHHLYGFNMIVLEAHELHNIQVKPQVKDYTEEELHKLEEYVTSWHKDTNNAVLLSEEVHNLFHNCKDKDGNVLYGSGNNTPEQFEEFRGRYMAGEFEDILEEMFNNK